MDTDIKNSDDLALFKFIQSEKSKYTVILPSNNSLLANREQSIIICYSDIIVVLLILNNRINTIILYFRWEIITKL